MTQYVILLGSAREASVNRKLGRLIESLLGEKAKLFDPIALDLPLYNGDEEEKNGLPPAMRAIRNAMLESKGMILVSPEYNSTLSPLLVNQLHWASRANCAPELSAFHGKSAFLASASPGSLGGMRMQVHLRAMLGTIGVHVYPTGFTLGQAFGAFDDSGRLKNAETAAKLAGLLTEFQEFTERL